MTEAKHKGPIVTISQGKVKGNVCTDARAGEFYSFEGIPFAKAPVGRLRFKAPVPAERWLGIYDATSSGKQGVQRNILTREIEGSEDCLNLNVFTPQLPLEHTKSSPILKPVFVFLHGGAFTSGSNSKSLYGPELLIREDIVLVTINYRIGFLGFLSLDDPNLGAPGNAAFKDMVLALKWVQQNISKFYGDPNNVCIGGTSAGAAAVQFLVLSPMAKGLFHKAICQSGSALNSWAHSFRNNAKMLAKYMNIDDQDDKTLLNKLVDAPVQEIFDAQERINTDTIQGNRIRFIGAVVENPSSNQEHFFTKPPIKHLVSGDYNKVPMLIGYNNADGFPEGHLTTLTSEPRFPEEIARIANVFLRFSSDFLMEILGISSISNKDFLASMIVDAMCQPNQQSIYWEDSELNVPGLLGLEKGSVLSKQLGEETVKFYLGNGKISRETHQKEFYDFTTDNCFLWGLYTSAKLHCETSQAPVYFYRHSLETDLNFYKGFLGIELPGVCHADELGYLFTNMFTETPELNSIENLGQKRFTRLWANFIKYSNPTPNPDPILNNVIWPPVKDRNNVYFLNIDQDLTVHNNPESERMKFWEKIYSLGSFTSKL